MIIPTYGNNQRKLPDPYSQANLGAGAGATNMQDFAEKMGWNAYNPNEMSQGTPNYRDRLGIEDASDFAKKGVADVAQWIPFYGDYFKNKISPQSGGSGMTDAESTLNEIPDIAHRYYDPYNRAGWEAYDVNKPIYERMAQDPTGYFNDLMKNYSMSDYAKNRLKESLGAASSTAAAGGMRGSFADIYDQSKIADAFSAQDQQQYYQNALQLLGMGLGGNQDIFNTGYGATSQLASDLMNQKNSMASLQFQRQMQQDAQDAESKAAMKKAWQNALGMALKFGMGGFGGGGGGDGGLSANPYGAIDPMGYSQINQRPGYQLFNPQPTRYNYNIG